MTTHQNNSGAAPPPAAALVAACEVRSSGPSGACRAFAISAPSARRRLVGSMAASAARRELALGAGAGRLDTSSYGGRAYGTGLAAARRGRAVLGVAGRRRAGRTARAAGGDATSVCVTLQAGSVAIGAVAWVVCGLALGMGPGATGRCDSGLGSGATAPCDSGLGSGATAPCDSGLGSGATAPCDSGLGSGATGPCDSGRGSGATGPSASGLGSGVATGPSDSGLGSGTTGPTTLPWPLTAAVVSSPPPRPWKPLHTRARDR